MVSPPNFGAALAQRGLVLHRMKRYTEANSGHEQLVLIAPESAWICFNGGLLLTVELRQEEAISDRESILGCGLDNLEQV